MNLLLQLKRINTKFLFLIFCVCLISSCEDGWVEVENEYFSFRKPEEIVHESPVAMYDDKQVSGMVAIDKIIVNFFINKDPKLVGPCTDYSEYTLQNATIENIDGQEYRLVYYLQKNNTYWLELCIDQKASFVVKDLPQSKLEQFKKMFMSIKLK